MRLTLLSLCLVLSIAVNAQNPKIAVGGVNNVYYEADLITNELMENYPSFGNEKYIYNQALGIDVKIYVDTVFKKYTIIFKDQEGTNTIMSYKYIRDYFLDSKSENPKLNKVYLMEIGPVRFMLSDRMDLYGINLLSITYEEKVDGKYTMQHTIKNVRKVIK